MKETLALIAFAVVVTVAIPVRAQSSYEDAHAAYESGDYRRAAELYEALVDAGVVHEDLFYNLGNAYFRAGELGPAIFNYERALRVEPHFADARYNLGVAREAVAETVVDRLERAADTSWHARLFSYLPLADVMLALLLLELLLFAALVASRFLEAGFVRTAVVVAVVFLGVAFGVALVLTVGAIRERETKTTGIVLPDEVELREGPDEGSVARSSIHAGLRVEIVDRDGAWSRVRLGNGVEGWVLQRAIGTLR